MVHIIKGDSWKRTSDASQQQLHYLKSKYGENWRAGVEKDSSVTSYDPGYASRAKARAEEQKKQSFTSSVKESAVEMAQKGKITGRQAERIINASKGL